MVKINILNQINSLNVNIVAVILQYNQGFPDSCFEKPEFLMIIDFIKKHCCFFMSLRQTKFKNHILCVLRLLWLKI